MIITIDPTAELDVDDDARWTREEFVDGSDMYRVFVDAVVLAVSVEALSDRDIGDVVGSIVTEYSSRPGFSREGLREIDVAGAETAYEFSMRWESERGVAMRSLVRVVANGDRAIVLHAAVPSALVDDLEGTERRLIESLRWSAEP